MKLRIQTMGRVYVYTIRGASWKGSSFLPLAYFPVSLIEAHQSPSNIHTNQ